MADDQILQHFKKAFSDIDTAISKARVLILLFKSELPQAISSLMIVYVTNITDDAAYNGEKSKHSKSGTFHKFIVSLELVQNG